MKPILKKAANCYFDSVLSWPLRNLYGGQGTCLVYHSITEERYHPDAFEPLSGLAVHYAEFEAQMKYIKSMLCPISLAEGVQQLQQGRLKKGSLMLKTCSFCE